MTTVLVTDEFQPADLSLAVWFKVVAANLEKISDFKNLDKLSEDQLQSLMRKNGFELILLPRNPR